MRTCGVNRNTFYYYYQDIYDLLDDIFQAEAKDVLTSTDSFESLEAAFLRAASLMLKRRKAVYSLFHSIRRDRLEKYLYEVGRQVLSSYVQGQAQGLEVGQEDVRLMTGLYAFTLVGTVLEWLDQGMEGDVEDIVRRISVLLQGSVRQALERAAQSRTDAPKF